MAAGTNTYIDSLLKKIGFVNCLETPRYPILTDTQIHDLNPQLIFLSSEPYPFSQIHGKVVSQAFPCSNVMLVDGEYFSWFGSRLVNATTYFESLIKQI
jgi:ABC-type Fe3+-hydroxamate transport system substrate-binding protein